MGNESGQATIEWTGVVLLVALGLAAAVALVPAVDGRSFGAFLAHKIVCAVRGGCEDGQSELAAAYGDADAELVRRFAPNIVYEPGEREIPVDWRECRSPGCGNAPDDRALDVTHTDAGARATAFTHVVHRDRQTYIQYWFYYPDSDSAFTGSHLAWKALDLESRLFQHRSLGRYPGFHHDDWEGYQVRLDQGGNVSVRATAHHGYRWCKQLECANTWGPATGWTRVSKGSHAGHIPLRSHLRGLTTRGEAPWVGGHYRHEPAYPGRDIHERTTAAPGLRLLPLETIDKGPDPRFDGIKPPWEKGVYRDPRLNQT